MTRREDEGRRKRKFDERYVEVPSKKVFTGRLILWGRGWISRKVSGTGEVLTRCHPPPWSRIFSEEWGVLRTKHPGPVNFQRSLGVEKVWHSEPEEVQDATLYRRNRNRLPMWGWKRNPETTLERVTSHSRYTRPRNRPSGTLTTPDRTVNSVSFVIPSYTTYFLNGGEDPRVGGVNRGETKVT